MTAYTDNPTISDTVIFDLITTDESGAAITPYKVNTVVIYFIERGFTVENTKKYTSSFGDTVTTQYFKEAVPVAIFGTDSVPAWIASDPDASFLTEVTEDEDNNPQIGVFRLEWVPTLAREGDYLLCYSWTPIVAGDTQTQNIQFYLYGDTKQTTAIPTHFTDPVKYDTLLERYLPEMFSTVLGSSDLTPNVVARFNQAVAKGFTGQEDLANQIVDLIDANAVSDVLLPYLGNLFGLRLFGTDVALWRKQIKQAVPLFKKKGTLEGLRESLANADIRFVSFTRMWQVVSEATWQEAFEVADEAELTFTLSESALLPVDADNFEIYVRLEGDTVYTEFTLDYVLFENSDGETTVTWVGHNLSVSPVSLMPGDFLRVVYKIAEPADQSLEDYIRMLPLADQRDETAVTLPHKNWNVRLIAENDPLFDVVIPTRHPFEYPLVFGRIRTEFPYSENIYNMEEYNGSTRNSTAPCHLDKSFADACSRCQSSKFVIDLEIEDLSAERLSEAEEIIRDFVPFHAVPHSINYSGSKEEFVPSPVEEIEILIHGSHEDTVVVTQTDFNRLIEEGTSNNLELKRNMLADTSTAAGSGTAYNTAITMFSSGIKFDALGIDGDDNFLEILSGSDQGEYQVSVYDSFTVDIVQGVPDTITWPLDTSAFPFNLSNKLYSDTVSIYQADRFVFSEADTELKFIDYGVMDDWKVEITAGPYAGTYQIDTINSDNTLTILGFPTTTTQTGLAYELQTSASAVRLSGTGSVVTKRVGRVETDLIVEELGINISDYVKYGGAEYKIFEVAAREIAATTDSIYIEDYTDGDVVGTAAITIYRRLVSGAVGYLNYRGIKVTGTVPTVSYVAETDEFRENYLILIGTNYYQITEISGSDMFLYGPKVEFGLTGTPVSYSIVRFIKTSPITTQNGQVYDRLDRRGNDAIYIATETVTPMAVTAMMLNSVNNGQPVDAVGQEESIWFKVEYR